MTRGLGGGENLRGSGGGSSGMPQGRKENKIKEENRKERKDREKKKKEKKKERVKKYGRADWRKARPAALATCDGGTRHRQ